MGSSAIEWTEATWNPTVGCALVSEGCRNCYAMKMAKRLQAMGTRGYEGVVNTEGKWTGRVNLVEAALTLPLRRKKPTMWFVDSMSDLFHPDVPFEWIDRVFAVMNASQFTLPADPRTSKPWHTYQILTKRPERMAEYMESRRSVKGVEHPLFKVRYETLRGMGDGGHIMNAGAVLQWPPSNVWLGTSVEDQQAADKRIPQLLECPAAVRFLSVEPLLGPLDLAYTCFNGADSFGRMPGIDWVIVGGESGKGARPCNVEWIREIVRQCKAAGVAAFVKQLGAESGVFHDRMHYTRHCGFWPPEKNADSWILQMKDRKGGDMAEWPEDLRVREMPDGCRTGDVGAAAGRSEET